MTMVMAYMRVCWRLGIPQRKPPPCLPSPHGLSCVVSTPSGCQLIRRSMAGCGARIRQLPPETKGRSR
eukprot:11325917-Ditylum_brightwellii.AAC.1